MKKFHIYIISVILTTMAVGCSEDYLERTPSDQVSSAGFFTQEKDLEYAVNAVYDLIGFNSWGRIYGSGTDLLRIEALTDNSMDHHSWNAGYRLADGTASASDGYSFYRWQERYRGIQRANRIIEGAVGIEDMSPDLKARYLAETLFLRAYFYFDLVYLFGDVPFITKSISPEEASDYARDDVNMIMGELIKDIDKVIPDLPDSYDNEGIGRATKGAAYTLKAKILLYQEKWAEAAAAAKSVIDLNVYSLYPNYYKLFDYEGINSEEVILDIQVAKDMDEGEFFVKNYGPNSVGGWSSGFPIQSLVDEYECIDGKTIQESDLFDTDNPYDNRDPRLYQSILYPDHEWQGGVFNSIPGATYPGETIVAGDDLTDGTGGQWNKTASGYNWYKYMSQTDIDISNFWDQGVHLILYRYADVLLMYAEAKIEAGDIDQSVYDAINEVRARPTVEMPAIASGKGQTEMREIVRRERRVELAFEGHRLMDIRRWRIAHLVMPGSPDGLTYTDPDTGEQKTLAWGDRVFDANKHYLWPIPQQEIDITGLEQNPGW